MPDSRDESPSLPREDLIRRIVSRASSAAVDLSDSDSGLVDRLAAYLELLARWNRRMNLTALAVDPPSDAAIDRLIVEPVAAARLIEANDQFVIDVGSGGGSPAIPFTLAATGVSLLMVEAREKKAAFLREAVRQLGLAKARVEAKRVEDLVDEIRSARLADVVTLRGVRFDEKLGRSLAAILSPRGRVLAFSSTEGRTDPPAGFIRTAELIVGPNAVIEVLRNEN